MGQIYVEIDASVANEGIMTMDASGGQESGGYWINWNASGFIGIAWYWDDTPIPAWWGNNHEGNGSTVKGNYGNSEEGFKQWIAAENPSNLDDALGSWGNDDKLAYLQKHTDIFLSSCMTS